MLICFSLYDKILSSFPTHKTETLFEAIANLLNLPSSLELSVDISILERTYCFQKHIYKNDKICRFQ